METKTENQLKEKWELKVFETSYDDLQLKYLKLDKLPVTKDEVSETTNLALLLNKKQDLIQELAEAIETETRLTLEYDHKSNKLLLETDFPEVLNDKRPTVAMKDGYIMEQLHDLYDAKVIAEENTKLLRKHLDLVDNRINLERTIINLRQGF